MLEKYYFISLVYTNTDGQGFGNIYIKSKDPVFKLYDLQGDICTSLKVKACVILYYKEVSKDEFDVHYDHDLNRIANGVKL